MKDWKKLLIAFICILLVVTSIQSAIYTSVETDTGLRISTKYSGLQLAANRTDFGTGEYLLRNESDRYELELGSFAEGSNVSYSNIFALVNTQDTDIEITNISVESEEGYSPYVRVWLHQDSSIPCPNEDIRGVETEETGGDWGNLTNEDTALIYYNGTASGGWRWPGSRSEERFVLSASENGYTNDELNLNNGGHFGWDENHNIWSGREGANNEDLEDSNAAWVQIDVMIPEDAGEQEISGTIHIYTQNS